MTDRDAWLESRRGRFTCSRFPDLMGGKTRMSDEEKAEAIAEHERKAAYWAEKGLAADGRGDQALADRHYQRAAKQEAAAEAVQNEKQAWTDTALTYLYQVAAERCGSYVQEIDSRPTRWGHENEQAGLLTYQAQSYHRSIEYCGTVFREYGEHAGGSPDAVIYDMDVMNTAKLLDTPSNIIGTVDVKCPYNPAEHMRTWHLREVPAKYVWQMHGHMLVTGARWCDFVSYDPRVTDGVHHLVIVRVERDADKLNELADRLAEAEIFVKSILTPAEQKE